MQFYIPRIIESKIKKSLTYSPVVALLGPRQCGKSTLAKHLLKNREDVVYLDLERPSDLAKLEEGEFYLSMQSKKLVCIDEVQKAPGLFGLLRSLVDEDRCPGRFLVLGSVSQELMRQSSETLAGRIVYHELTPFLEQEVHNEIDPMVLWERGGFPNSTLAVDQEISWEWRESFIQTFLERDLAQFNYHLPSITMRRFWTMLAHSHGQVANYTKLGQALDVSHTTIKRWIDIFEQTFMIRVLRSYNGNVKKRLVKAPKIYIRDSGLLHALLDIEDMDELLGHPVAGASWEGFALENIVPHFPRHQVYYYRTSSSEEVDLLLERKGKTIGIEFKLSASPKLSRGLPATMETLGLSQMFVVTPVVDSFWLKPKMKACGIRWVVDEINNLYQ